MVRARYLIAFSLCACLAVGTAGAAELDEETKAAYDTYVEKARQRFLARVRAVDLIAPADTHASALRDGRALAQPGHGSGIMSVPKGLVHHWSGAMFIAGATLEQVLAVSHSYADYHTIYDSIIESRVAEQDGNTFHLELRVREGVRGVRVVLDIRSRVEYFSPSHRFAYALSRAHEIREIKNAGRSDEQALPVGHDSGYLWGASTFTSFSEHENGVYVELETFGLSRRFPPLMGWIIEPIARRLGRKSVEGSLEEFRTAITERHVAPERPFETAGF